jgi:hypothetical protein
VFVARQNIRHVKAAAMLSGTSPGWFEAAHNAVYDFEFTNPLSWACWWRIGSGEVGGSVRLMLGKLTAAGKGWYQEVNGLTGQLQLGLSHAFAGTQLLYIQDTGAAVTDGLWHHIAVTYDGSSTHAGLKLYVDGAARTVTTLGTLPGSPTMKNTETVKLGTSVTSWGRRAHDFAVWNVALTPTQVLDVYGAGRVHGKVPRLEKAGPPPWPAPVTYWALRRNDVFPIPEKMGTGLTMAAQSTPAMVTR